MHIRTLVTAGAVLALAPSALAQTVVITNVMVLDGTGTPARRADVRIVDGTIESIGGGHSLATDRVIDARGLTLAPGFIDTHSHHDRGIFDAPRRACSGQPGRHDHRGRPGRRVAAAARLVLRTARFAAGGDQRRLLRRPRHAPTPRDGRRLQARRDGQRSRAHEAACCARRWLPARSVCRPASSTTPASTRRRARCSSSRRWPARRGGRYISHMRSEDREFWEALDELIAIGRDANDAGAGVAHEARDARALGTRRPAHRDARCGARAKASTSPPTSTRGRCGSRRSTVLYPKRNFTDRTETEFILKEIASPDDLVLGTFHAEPVVRGQDGPADCRAARHRSGHDADGADRRVARSGSERERRRHGHGRARHRDAAALAVHEHLQRRRARRPPSARLRRRSRASSAATCASSTS